MKTSLKLIVVFSLSVLSAGAGASTNILSPSSLVAGAISSGKSEHNPPQASPIRQANVTYTVVRQLITQKPHGELDFTHEQACQVKATVNVYDFRGSQDSYMVDPSVVNCDLTFQGQPATIQLGSIVALGTGNGEYPGFGTGDFKMVNSFAHVANRDHLPVGPRMPGATAATRDITQRSFMMFMNPNINVECRNSEDGSSDCKVDHPESLSVYIEIED